jgi:ankyrin repeat protein
MLELGFDPATPDQNGAIALQCAAFEGSAACVRLLLQHPKGPDLVNYRDPVYHGTAFGWCSHGSRHGPQGRPHAEVARLLLEAGSELPDDLSVLRDDVRAVVKAWQARR